LERFDVNRRRYCYHGRRGYHYFVSHQKQQCTDSIDCGDAVRQCQWQHSKSVELDGHPDNAKLLRDSFTSGGWDAFWRESVRLRQGLGLGSMIRLAAANESEKEVAVKRLLEQAEKGGFWVFLIKTDPLYDPLRSDSRFQELLKKFNPPQ
jgi:hypothetical protein